MSKLVVFTHLTLDGVSQAPGRPDEDSRGRFSHGGWESRYADPVMAEVSGRGIANGGTLLFGRRTWEDFAGFWPHQPADSPFTEVLNRFPKLVASRTLKGPLSWANSSVIRGDVPTEVARLKEQPGKDLVVLGSGELVRTLMAHRLVDEYVLLLHPLVLGTGLRLFADGTPRTELRLVEVRPTTTGVLIATYAPE